jgi:hypothetical protein
MIKYGFSLSLSVMLLFFFGFSNLAMAAHVTKHYNCNQQTCLPTKEYWIQPGDSLTINVNCVSPAYSFIDNVFYSFQPPLSCSGNQVSPSAMAVKCETNTDTVQRKVTIVSVYCKDEA